MNESQYARLINALESIAASLQDIADHTRGQLTMELGQDRMVGPDPETLKVQVNFDDLETPEWSTPPEPEKEYTRDDVIAALNALAKKSGPEVGKKVLASCGVAKLAELAPEKYGQVIKACEAL